MSQGQGHQVDNSSKMLSITYHLVVITSLLLVRVAATTPPNIVVIMVDDLGYNDVSYHGSEIWTPNIDQLAVNGIRLGNYYTAPQCGPSRAQFFSGRYGIHLGTQHNNFAPCRPSGLPLKYPTMAEEMKKLNYSTHMIGKWHLGYHTEEFLPTNRGFDTFRGMLLGGGDHYKHSKKYGNMDAIDFYEGTDPFNNTYGQYSTHVFTRRAENIIKFYGKTQEKPLFMWLSYQAVHAPIQVPEKYEAIYNFIPDKNRRRLAGMMAALDEGVGQVVQALKEAEIYENTVIVFSTDNGGQASAGSSNAPLRGNKNTLFEGGVKGVGFLSGGALTRGGDTFQGLMHITDWMPTLLHLAGGDESQLDLDGVNQWESISTGSDGTREEVLLNIDELDQTSQLVSQSTVFDTRIQAGLIWQNWKILTGNPGYNLWVPPPQKDYALYQSYAESLSNRATQPNETLYLFNLDLDPFEAINLVNILPDIAMDLLSKLNKYRNTALPAHNPPHNKRCNPHRNGHFWGPYMSKRRNQRVTTTTPAAARTRATFEPARVAPIQQQRSYISKKGSPLSIPNRRLPGEDSRNHGNWKN